MKKFLLTLVILAGITVCTLASPVQPEKRQKGSKAWSKELNLSEEQQQKIKSLNSEFREKFRTLRENSSLTKADKQKERKNLAEQRRTGINELLNPEQQTKFKEWTEKRKDRKNKGMRKHKGNFAKNQPGKHHRFGRQDLNLSEEQKLKIKELNTDFRKKSGELRAQHRSDINNILTPEQQNKWKERSIASKENRGRPGKFAKKEFTPETAAKLKTLKENYLKEKNAIELSRIAPEEQNRRKEELKANYRKERREIRKSQNNK